MFAKKMVSLEDIESQTALELPARELMTVNNFTNFATSDASNTCSASAGNGLVSVLDIAAAVCIQNAVAGASAGQTVS
ncbi:MAG: hypothetical protein JO202_02565 [Ktedonobacteraceae bacterium]|nr:hypothetical protein [Ktedonobacteraceae bacterium]